MRDDGKAERRLKIVPARRDVGMSADALVARAIDRTIAAVRAGAHPDSVLRAILSALYPDRGGLR